MYTQVILSSLTKLLTAARSRSGLRARACDVRRAYFLGGSGSEAIAELERADASHRLDYPRFDAVLGQVKLGG